MLVDLVDFKTLFPVPDYDFAVLACRHEIPIALADV